MTANSAPRQVGSANFKWWLSINRFWLHTLVGGVIVGFLWLNPFGAGIALAAIYAYLFEKYEFSEDRYVKDEAWRDISGAMAGLIIFSLIGKVISVYA